MSARIPPPALARSAIDRVGHRRLDPGWLAVAWDDPATRVVVVEGNRSLVRGDSPVRLVTVPTDEAPPGQRYLLGCDADGRAYFAVDASHLPELGDGARPVGLREAGALLPDLDAGLLVQAVALSGWHRAHPRCARCGAATVVEAAGYLRRCPEDGSEHHPRTDPAVIMLVTDADDRALLGRQHRWPPGRFSTLAGFVEPGESLEQAVAREVLEEVGVPVRDVRYLGSQPWPFPASLMVGFVAEATRTAIEVDGDEIAEARWFTREGLTEAFTAGEVTLPPPVSIARGLIEQWYGGRIGAQADWQHSHGVAPTTG